MIKRMFHFLPAILMLGILVACETPLQIQEFSDLTYGHLGAMNLNVGEVRIDDEYASPMKAPNIEHLIATPPAKALRRWAADRLLAAGKLGSARFIVVEASVVETPLKLDKSFTGTFTTQQAARYDATVEGRLEILDARGVRTAFASARISRSRTIKEGATLNERDQLWFELVEASMNDFNKELEKNIRRHLAAWLM